MPKTFHLVKCLLIVLLLLLQACSSVPSKHKPSGGKSASRTVTIDEDGDGPPLVDRDVSLIPNATPRLEPLSRYGNPPHYKALGSRYYVMGKSDGYRAEGTASWYGRKFHGQRTSSGEPYDMFGMTAAHRSLPLPTYAQVTNLDNGKEVIVKINDRGPFVHNRLIDLSYAAAKKLGIHQAGTGRVRIAAIDPIAWHQQQKGAQLAKAGSKSAAKKGRATQLAMADKPPQAKKTTAKATVREKSAHKATTVAANKQMYIQLGSFVEKNNAQQLANKATILTQALNDIDVHVMPKKSAKKEIYQVRIGPIKDKQQAQKLQKQLVALNKKAPSKIVYE